MGKSKTFDTPSTDHAHHMGRIADILAQPHMKQYREFECPTMCGCVVRELAVWNPKGTKILYDGPESIVSQCLDHGHLQTAEALYGEIYNYHGRAWHAPCGCTVHSWCDDRDGETKAHTPTEHPDHTARCSAHAKHKDPVKHHAAVLTYAQKHPPADISE